MRALRRSEHVSARAPRALSACVILSLSACTDSPSHGASDSGTTDSSAIAECAELFDLEPPGTTPPSAWADVESLDAVLTFDVAAQRTTAEVTWTIRTGPSADPIAFDLHQEPDVLVVDGTEIPAAEIARVALPGTTESSVRLLPVSPCRTHVVTARYELSAPLRSHRTPTYGQDLMPRYDEHGVVWSPGMTDAIPDAYLELWLPASLVHDTFASTIRFVVVGGAPHRLFANGAIETTTENDWTVRYPDSYRSNSHFWYLVPSEGLRVIETSVGETEITVVASPEYPYSIDPRAEDLVSWIPALDRWLGPYPHPAFLAVITESGVGMEYAGATVSPIGALRHELIHSWVGRGAYPRRDRHNWVDEALTSYYDRDRDAALMPAGPPTELEGTGWARGWHTDDHYIVGRNLMRACAWEMGVETLREVLRDFVIAHQGRDYTTDDLRTALYCGSSSMPLLRVFDRQVFGLDEPRPAPDCDR